MNIIVAVLLLCTVPLVHAQTPFADIMTASTDTELVYAYTDNLHTGINITTFTSANSSWVDYYTLLPLCHAPRLVVAHTHLTYEHLDVYIPSTTANRGTGDDFKATLFIDFACSRIRDTFGLPQRPVRHVIVVPHDGTVIEYGYGTEVVHVLRALFDRYLAWWDTTDAQSAHAPTPALESGALIARFSLAGGLHFAQQSAAACGTSNACKPPMGTMLLQDPLPRRGTFARRYQLPTTSATR